MEEKGTRKLKRALRLLEKETKRLKDEQGRIARRNARRNVLDALRTVRSALDEEYPVARKDRAPTKRRTRRDSEVPENFSEISKETKRFGQLIKAGIRIIARPKEMLSAPSWPKTGTLDKKKVDVYFAPTWAVFAPPDTTIEQLKRARRSPTERNALATLGRLWREQAQVQKRLRDDAKRATYLMSYGADAEKIYEKMLEERRPS